MTSKRKLIFLAVLITTLASLWAACSGSKKRPPFEPSWVLIKKYAGAIAPGEEVTARVYMARHLSDGCCMDTPTFLQNKIEVLHDGLHSVFLWPDDKSYAAGWAEVIDLDNNGDKEFIIGGSTSARVVSYARGQFGFRPELDDILSIEYDIGPFDLDADGRYEFVEGQAVEISPLRFGAPVPRIKRWSSEAGFVDCSGEFKWYYEQRLIPELQSKLAKEMNAELRSAYEQTLRELDALIKRGK